MKKGIIICLLFILLIGFIYAEETTTPEIKSNLDIGKDFQIYSNSLLSKQITIPDYLQGPTKIIFGLQDNNIDLQNFIVLFSIWFFLVFLIQAILEIIPFFGEGFKSWFGAIIITLLISITGSIRNAANWLFGFGGAISLMKDWGLLKIIFTILILVILAFGLKKILHILKHGANKTENYAEGKRISMLEDFMKMFTEEKH